MKPTLENPCPIRFSSKFEGNFSCKFCKTNVQDMRNKSKEEINAFIQDTTAHKRCAIFLPSQISKQSKTSPSLHSYFRYALASVLLVFGFNISILSAQEVQEKEQKNQEVKMTSVDKRKKNVCYIKEHEEETNSKEKKTRKRRFINRRKKKMITGCPSF